MSIKITKECISCGACEPECPNNAIFESKKSDFNKNRSNYKDTYYIVSEKCTECIGFYDEPQCVSICPVNCCVPDNI